jgi:hypothetical protein
MTVSEDKPSPVDVASYIDQQPVGGFQIKLLLTCAAVLLCAGHAQQLGGESPLPNLMEVKG